MLIVGAGPTGLGAATRLHQLGHPNWLLCDAVSRRRRALPPVWRGTSADPRSCRVLMRAIRGSLGMLLQLLLVP